MAAHSKKMSSFPPPSHVDLPPSSIVSRSLAHLRVLVNSYKLRLTVRKRGWAQLADKALNICKLVNKHISNVQSPWLC